MYLVILSSESDSRSVMSDSLWPRGLYSPWNSPGQNTGVYSLSLLQGFFTSQGSNPDLQGSNPGLPHCRQILYQLSHKRSPRILEWVAYPFSSRSFQLRNQTGVSCIAGNPFISSATREVPILTDAALIIGWVSSFPETESPERMRISFNITPLD